MAVTNDIKRCSTCKVPKPVSAFGRVSRSNDGLNCQCLDCRLESTRKHRRKKGAKQRRAVPAGMKYCPQCETDLPLEEFCSNASTHDGLQKYCTKCQRSYNNDRNQRPDVKEKKNAFDRLYSQTKSGKQTSRRSTKLYERSDRGKQKRVERIEQGIHAEYQRRYRKKYPLKYMASQVVGLAKMCQFIPFAQELSCRFCGVQAEEYHHYSYLPQHWLDVIPVCKKCHEWLHHDTDHC